MCGPSQSERNSRTAGAGRPQARLHIYVDPDTCTLDSSQEPCPLRAGALYMSGVREVRFAGRDPYAGSVDLFGTTRYLSRKPILVVWLGPWRDILPEGVKLGEDIYRSSWLDGLRQGGDSVATVISGLAAVRAAK